MKLQQMLHLAYLKADNTCCAPLGKTAGHQACTDTTCDTQPILRKLSLGHLPTSDSACFSMMRAKQAECYVRAVSSIACAVSVTVLL